MGRAASLWMLLSGLPSEAQTGVSHAAHYPIAPSARLARQKLGFGVLQKLVPPAPLVVGYATLRRDRHAGDNPVDFP